jgi:pSer/pThr/pTyr-binding forkhead associated (FHA) protein
MASLVLRVLTGGDAGKRAKLDRDVEVGSDPAAGFALEDSKAAPRHARIAVEGAKVRVRDLGSPGGTYVNDVRIEKSKRVRPGDRVRIGQTVLELLTAQQAAADHDLPSVSGPPPVEHPAPPIAPVEGSMTPPLRVTETTADFVPNAEAEQRSAVDRYGPLAAWTDSRVKHQTYAAAIGLLAASGLVVLVFVLD